MRNILNIKKYASLFVLALAPIWIIFMVMSPLDIGAAPPEASKVSAAAKPDVAPVPQKINQDQVPSLENVAEAATNMTTKVFFSFIIFILIFGFLKVSVLILHSLAEKRARYRFFKKITPFLQMIMWGGTVYFITRYIFHPSKDTLFAVMTASGVAVGFAAQDILKNIFGGITIILNRPFQIGDKIKVGQYYGEVVSIGLRNVRIVTPDDSLVSIPNAELVNQSVSNANSGVPDCQVVTEIFVPSGVDLNEAKRIAWEAAATSRYVYLRKPLTVLVQDASTDFIYRMKIKIKAYVFDHRFEFLFSSEVTQIVYEEFHKIGILVSSMGKSKNGAPSAVGIPGIRKGKEIV